MGKTLKRHQNDETSGAAGDAENAPPLMASLDLPFELIDVITEIPLYAVSPTDVLSLANAQAFLGDTSLGSHCCVYLETPWGASDIARPQSHQT